VHLTQRGNNRAPCFRRESDYLLYLLHLRELSARLECAVHAYCLMTNHVHLLLSPASPQACVTLMKHLGQRYAQYFNRTYGRTGSLWDGRYHSSVAQTERYVLGCYRYIELNPVDAGMVDDPGVYAWSSYRANALGKDDRIVSPHAAYLALGLDAVARRDAYAALFDDALDPALVAEIRAATREG
jgi:putative transposase